MEDLTAVRALFADVRSGNIDAVKAALTENETLRDVDSRSGSWLHVAAQTGSVPMVKLMLDLGFEPNKKAGILGGNALNEAASSGHLAVVEVLIDAGSEIDQSHQRVNPLFAATYNGHSEIVRLLLKHGAKPDSVYTRENGERLTPESYARQLGKSEIADLIKSWAEKR